MPGYYDFVLAFIPVSLAGVAGVLTVAGFALTTAVSVAGLLALSLVGHAMFVRAPVEGGIGREETVERTPTAAPPSAD